MIWPNDLIGHSAEHRRRHLETPDKPDRNDTT